MACITTGQGAIECGVGQICIVLNVGVHGMSQLRVREQGKRNDLWNPTENSMWCAQNNEIGIGLD